MWIIHFFSKEITYKDKTTGGYKPRDTKLINVDEKIFFTTRIAKQDYGEYLSKENFQNDIKELVKYTIEYTKEENQKTINQKELQEFTKEHIELKK